MTDREITLLSYLADQLLARPNHFHHLIAQLREGKECSQEFIIFLNTLEKMFAKHRPSNAEDVRKMGRILSVSDDIAERRTAEVLLNWAM